MLSEETRAADCFSTYTPSGYHSPLRVFNLVLFLRVPLCHLLKPQTIKVRHHLIPSICYTKTHLFLHMNWSVSLAKSEQPSLPKEDERKSYDKLILEIKKRNRLPLHLSLLGKQERCSTEGISYSKLLSSGI